jgi:hypothetical protein
VRGEVWAIGRRQFLVRAASVAAVPLVGIAPPATLVTVSLDQFTRELIRRIAESMELQYQDLAESYGAEYLSAVRAMPANRAQWEGRVK